MRTIAGAAKCLGIAVAPRDSNRVYACGLRDSVYDWMSYGAVYRSTNGGTNWTTITANLPSFIVGGYDNYWSANCLAVTPADADTVFLGTSRGVFKTVDGGESWSTTTLSASTAAMILDPLSGALYAGTTSQGAFVSNDSGGSWSPMNLGLTSLQCRCLDLDATNRLLYLGTYGGGAWKIRLDTPKLKAAEAWSRYE